jgi:hypothetical protein
VHEIFLKNLTQRRKERKENKDSNK